MVAARDGIAEIVGTRVVVVTRKSNTVNADAPMTEFLTVADIAVIAQSTITQVSVSTGVGHARN